MYFCIECTSVGNSWKEQRNFLSTKTFSSAQLHKNNWKFSLPELKLALVGGNERSPSSPFQNTKRTWRKERGNAIVFSVFPWRNLWLVFFFNKFVKHKVRTAELKSHECYPVSRYSDPLFLHATVFCRTLDPDYLWRQTLIWYWFYVMGDCDWINI